MAENKVYFGQFENYENMIMEWGNIVHTPIPNIREVLFASYGAEHYEGDAIVLFMHNGKLYEVNGGHCSCYGLSESHYCDSTESQWQPEETTWEALSKRKLDSEQHTEEAIRTFENLVASHKV